VIADIAVIGTPHHGGTEKNRVIGPSVDRIIGTTTQPGLVGGTRSNAKFLLCKVSTFGFSHVHGGTETA